MAEGNGLAHRDIVLKPAKCGGTDGVTLVRAGQDWPPVFDALLANPNGYGVRNEQVVAQEYVRGTEYLVDTVSFDGRHTVDVIGRYSKVTGAERMAVYESIEFDVAVAEYAKDVLDALGIRFGPAHTEIIVSEAGPVLVECGARLAGGGLPAASRHATRMNSIDRLVRYLAGSTEIPDAYRLSCTVMAVFLLLDRGGVVRNAEVYEEIRALSTTKYFPCDVRDGDVVRPSSDLPASLNHVLALLVGRDRNAVLADRLAVREIEARLVLAEEDS